MYHGYISNFIIGCALCPIVKNNIASLSDSSNYRAIALGSLFIKVLDNCIIYIFKNNMNTHELQFAFQSNSSTTMCSWAVLEVIKYYNNRKGFVTPSELIPTDLR